MTMTKKTPKNPIKFPPPVDETRTRIFQLNEDEKEVAMNSKDNPTVLIKESDLNRIRSAYEALSALESILAESEFSTYIEFACVLKLIVDKFPTVITDDMDSDLKCGE